jgi:methyltransferase (TIGR00027 family)
MRDGDADGIGYGHASLGARWVAAQWLRLERTRPSTPGGDLDAERRLYRAVAGTVSVPAARSSALAQRTRVIDAEVARALGHGTNQIVLLGAGLDGRALRFGGGAVRWFEVDRPAAQEDKRNRLRALDIATTGTTFIALDLLADDLEPALDAAGHDANAPSLFVAEGLFDTLTLEATASLCAAVRARAAPGSVLVATFSVAPEGGELVRGLRAATGLVRRVTDEPRRNEFRPGDAQKLMVVTGWRVTHAESSPQRRLDPGAHTLILVCEPDPARGR